MAQPLENRITAALRSSSRIKDVESTIADVEAEIGSTQKKYDGEQARSIDPALTTSEAREARNNAADFEHDIRRLNASLDLLKARRQAILDDESYALRMERYNLAAKERDELVAIIRERYPLIVLELISLIERIDANDTECQSVNRDRPREKPILVSAEAIGRGCPGNFYWDMSKGGGPVHRLSQISLPLPFSDEMALPIPSFPNSPLRRAAQISELQKYLAELAGGVTHPEAANA